MTDSAPWEDLITLDRIMSLHAEAINRYGGAADIRTDTKQCVEGALGSAWNAELYAPVEGAEPGLGFAAYLLRYLNSRHCFVDGNKRVAWLAMVDVFRAKRLEIDATEEEAEDLVNDVIVNDLPVSEITYWIADRLQWVH